MVRKLSLLGLCYRRSRPDGDHVSECVDPWGGPHRDRNLGRDWGVDLVHWLGPPLCRVGAAMNAFVFERVACRHGPKQKPPNGQAGSAPIFRGRQAHCGRGGLYLRHDRCQRRLFRYRAGLDYSCRNPGRSCTHFLHFRACVRRLSLEKAAP